MPQSRKVTKAQERQQAAEQAAREALAGYKPKTGKVFEGARGFVGAQVELMDELQEGYKSLMDERTESRSQLRSLFKQGLLSREEAERMFLAYPDRTRKDGDETNGAEAPADEPAPGEATAAPQAA